MASEIELTGVSDIIAKLNTMSVNINKLVNTALKKSAEPVLEDAKATVVFKDVTGKGRAGLSISNIKTQDGIKYVLVGVDKSDVSKIFYMKMVEFGTVKMPARPFLSVAFEKNKSNVNQIIKDVLSGGLK
jgi:HK97 gp10 family phage protein